MLGEEQNRFDITQLKDGPYKTEEVFKTADAIEFTVDNQDDSVTKIQFSPNKYGEQHTLLINLEPFKISHEINGNPSQMTINADNLLSIEKNEVPTAEEQKCPYDSRAYFIDSKEELFNEKEFV